MRFFHGFNDCVVFFLFCLIYCVFEIFSLNRTVGRDLYNVHSVNITELFFLSQGSTCHTALLLILVEQVLECNSCQCLALSSDLHMLFCFDRLMQSVRIPSSRHDTSGELIHDHNLSLLSHHVILIAEHQVMRTQRQNDVVLDLQILRICQVLDMEEVFYLLHTVFCQIDNLFFLVDNKISGLFNIFSHDRIDLGKLTACFSSFQLACQNIACLIQFCRFITLSGNDQRSSGFIDQYGVNLIDNRKVQPSLYKLFLVDHHVVSQIIKSQFVVRYICNITIICRTALIIVHIIENHTDCQSQKFVYFSHPLGITLCQIIIDCDNVNAFSFQRIQICRKCGYQCLTFTCTHLCNTSLMQDDTADQLYPVMAHPHTSICTFSYNCICLRENIIQCLSLFETFFKLSCLIL